MLTSKYKKIRKAKSILGVIVIILSMFFLLYKDQVAQPNIILLVDLSHSMNTQDITNNSEEKISRLEATKDIIINNLLPQITHQKIGLIVFAERAFYHIPPTYDRKQLISSIEKLHTNILPIQGSNIMQALEYTDKLSDKKQQIIAITDGGEESEFVYSGSLIEDMTIIGIGTTKGGVVRNTDGNIYKDKNGEAHTSIRNDEFLQKLMQYHKSDILFVDKNTISTSIIKPQSSITEKNKLMATILLAISAILFL